MKQPILILLILLFSCGTPSKKKPCPQITESTSVEKLNKILDFTKHRPTRVRFKHMFCDNSGTENRSVPGPSDFYLEALMFFDPETFMGLQMMTQIDTEPHPIPDYKKEEFNFDWLDQEIRDELMASDTSYHGHHNLYFGLGGKVWMMDNKLLLYCSSND